MDIFSEDWVSWLVLTLHHAMIYVPDSCALPAFVVAGGQTLVFLSKTYDMRENGINDPKE